MITDPDDAIALPREARYGLFLQAARTSGQLWTLAEEEALLVLGMEGHDEFVVAFPQADVVGEWFETTGMESADLVAMGTEDWTSATLDELGGSGVEVCVFPTADDEGHLPFRSRPQGGPSNPLHAIIGGWAEVS